MCEDLNGLLSSNRLKYNAHKTEFTRLATRQKLLKVTQQCIDVNGDLDGVIIDEEPTMTARVNRVVSGCFYQIRQLRNIYGVTYRSMAGEHL